MQKQARHFYAFGPFQLDSQERILRRNGQPIGLTPKAVDILLLLVQNAGHLVDKDELMRHVWPDAFVEESNLTKNVSVLRKTLGASEDGHEYIETKPRRGYWFAGHVDTWSEDEERIEVVPEDSLPRQMPKEPGRIERIDRGRGYALARQSQAIQEAPPTALVPERTVPAAAGLPRQEALETDTQPRHGRWLVRGLAAALVIIVAVAVIWAVLPTPSPRVLRTIQLTHFGRVDYVARLVTDGTGLRFMERRGGHYSLAQVGTEGGEPVAIITQFSNTRLLCISPDQSELLVSSIMNGEDEGPLWVLPMSGGSPRRLGNVIAHDAAWSPDGHRIVYTAGSAIYLVKADGSEPRKLVSTDDVAFYVRWSPDGRFLRFTLGSRTLSLWEVTAEGKNLHRLLAGWREPCTQYGDGESGGDWTPDGKYFVFRSTRARNASIWAIREKSNWLRRSSGPTLLTTTDLYVWNVSVAGDGKRVLFGAGKEDRELQRYDFPSNEFVPYLSGVPARWVSFSRDGRWVAYVTAPAPGFILWRDKLNGGDRLQLTFPPAESGTPRWSPNGKLLAFRSGTAICVLSPDGGNPEAVTPEPYGADDAEWSPDGNALLFSAHPAGDGGATWAIYRIDLKTRNVSRLPGSQGLRAPAFSPDGKYVAATSVDPPNRLMLFDVQAERWTGLAQANTFYVPPYWSRDGKYVYAQDVAGVDQPVFRVRISDRKRELVTTLKQFARADATAYSLAGLTPDGEPLASLLRSNSDIYALDIDFR